MFTRRSRGVITDQQVTAAAGTQGLASPNAFVISDLSHVWMMCDVYENDLPFVRLGEFADIKLNAYPDRTFRGRIGNIGPILDPNTTHREGSHRSGKRRLDAPRHVRHRDLPRAAKGGCARRFPRRRCCICTIAIGSMCRRGNPGQFRRVEVTGG